MCIEYTDLDIEVVLEGGFVRNVIIDGLDLRAMVRDYDCDGATPEELSVDEDGDEYITYWTPM